MVDKNERGNEMMWVHPMGQLNNPVPLHPPGLHEEERKISHPTKDEVEKRRM